MKLRILTHSLYLQFPRPGFTLGPRHIRESILCQRLSIKDEDQPNNIMDRLFNRLVKLRIPTHTLPLTSMSRVDSVPPKTLQREGRLCYRLSNKDEEQPNNMTDRVHRDGGACYKFIHCPAEKQCDLL